MEKGLKLNYFERLIAQNGSDTYFIEQFLKGSGNELAGKFWSDKSSSRLCFDLYSWFCTMKDIKDFQFEKQLPGVLTGKNRTSGVPNIDVFFQKGDDIIFIESKYTESCKWKYKKDKTNNGYYLSEAYWGENGYKSCTINIGERFYGNSKVAEIFSTFCSEIQREIDTRKNEHQRFSWFDPKQETCHLFGIIFYVINNKIENKNIFLCNNVWECEKSGDCFDISGSIVEVFKNKAEEILNEIFKDNKCKFTFEVNKIQDIMQNGFKGFDFPNARLFAMDDVSLTDFINQNYRLDKR